jgi:hypothetical protein
MKTIISGGSSHKEPELSVKILPTHTLIRMRCNLLGSYNSKANPLFSSSFSGGEKKHDSQRNPRM